MRRLVIAVVCTVFAAVVGAATPARAAVRYVDQLFADVDVETNVIYGQAYNSQGVLEQLKLDIYTAQGDTATNRPLYVWVHGGNFRVGDKASSGPLRDYVRRGWVGVSINYRLRPELPGNAALGALTNPASLPPFIQAVKDAQHDAQAAIRYARAHAADANLRIDPSRVAIGGISAGGITALMVAFNPKTPGSSGTPGQSSAVSAAVSHAGTYAPVLLGAGPVLNGSPPIAVYHGTSDEQVPYPTAPLPCVLTLAMLNDCEFVTFVGQGHQTMGTELARDFLYRHVIVGRTTLNTPLVLDSAPNIAALAGVEPPGVNLGATAGVVVPSDPQIVIDELIQFLEYSLNAIGLPIDIA